MANFEKVYPNIKLGEGGYGNSSKDPGNYCGGKIVGTNHGIAAILYKSVLGRCPTADEMRNLSATKAKEIWKQYFWDKLDGDNVPLDSLAELYLYSTGGGINGWLHIRQSANRVAGKKLFEEKPAKLSLAQMQIVNKLDGKKMYKEMSAIREDYFKNHSNRYYVDGWLNRLNRINQRFALEVKNFANETANVAKQNPKSSIGIALLLIVGGAYLLYKYKYNA